MVLMGQSVIKSVIDVRIRPAIEMMALVVCFVIF